MKKFLRWLLDFLDRKFPDKVIVTAARYAELEKKQKAMIEDVRIIFERLDRHDTNLLHINQSIGISGSRVGALER